MLLLQLYATLAWLPKGVAEFFAAADVGLFASYDDKGRAPDVMVSLNVAGKPADVPMEKKDLTYFVWEKGKVPEFVLEVVSNRKGKELDKKKARLCGLGHRLLRDLRSRAHLLQQEKGQQARTPVSQL